MEKGFDYGKNFDPSTIFQGKAVNLPTECGLNKYIKAKRVSLLRKKPYLMAQNTLEWGT